VASRRNPNPVRLLDSELSDVSCISSVSDEQDASNTVHVAHAAAECSDECVTVGSVAAAAAVGFLADVMTS